MNKKRIIINIVAAIFIFLIGFIIHGIFEWIPFNLLAVFVPINESIFEHIKMIFTSYMVYIIVKKVIYNKINITESNYLFKELLTTIFEIILFLSIFLPLFYTHNENIMITLLVYFITIVISMIFNYFITFKNNYRFLNILSFIVIIAIYILFGYLTFKPPINDFFLDSTNNSYGLNKWFSSKYLYIFIYVNIYTGFFYNFNKSKTIYN